MNAFTTARPAPTLVWIYTKENGQPMHTATGRCYDFQIERFAGGWQVRYRPIGAGPRANWGCSRFPTVKIAKRWAAQYDHTSAEARA